MALTVSLGISSAWVTAPPFGQSFQLRSSVDMSMAKKTMVFSDLRWWSFLDMKKVVQFLIRVSDWKKTTHSNVKSSSFNHISRLLTRRRNPMEADMHRDLDDQGLRAMSQVRDLQSFASCIFVGVENFSQRCFKPSISKRSKAFIMIYTHIYVYIEI